MEKNIHFGQKNWIKCQQKKNSNYSQIFLDNLTSYEQQHMSEVSEIKKVKVYKKRLRDGFFLTIVLWGVIFLLSFYKQNNFINYIFWFILVANGILFAVSAYIFILTLIKSVEIIKITKELDLNENSIKGIFKY